MGMVADWIQDAVKHLLEKVKGAAHGIASQALATFGLTIVTWDQILPNLQAFVVQHTSGISGQAAQLLGYLGVGQAISMVLSALTVRMAWKTFIVPKTVADTLTGGSS